MATRYVFNGAARILGRFGNVVAGDVLDLTDAEVVTIEGNAEFAPVPAILNQPIIIDKTGDYTVLNADSGKLIRTKQTAAIAFALPAAPALGQNHKIIDAGATGAATHNITINPGAKSIKGIAATVASIAVSAPGTGFTSRPTVAIAGDGSEATATATLKAIAAALVGAGADYAADDVLTVAGGTQTEAITITVLTVDGGGAILTFEITTAGIYTALPANPVAVTGGAGTGATFTITWGVQAVAVTAAGTGYITATATIVGGGGSGATLAVTLAGVVKTVNTNGAQFNVYWNGVQWVEFT